MSKTTTLIANRDLNKAIVATRYWKVGSASTVSNEAEDNLYIGVSDAHRRSRIIFYPNPSVFTNETITSITLTVNVKKTYSSTAKTARTAIRCSSTNANTDEAYTAAGLITNEADFTTAGVKTITITDSAIISNISTWCKNGTPFSLYFGRGVHDDTKAYGIQIYGYTTANPPKLSIEHIPSASTASIDSNPTIGSNIGVTIQRASSEYSHKVKLQSAINSGIILEQEVGKSDSTCSFTIEESNTKNWISDSSSYQSNTKLIIETYLGGTKLGSYTTYFTLYAKTNPVVMWDDENTKISAKSGTLDYLMSGYGNLTLNLKATPVDDGSSIPYFRVQINSCNISINRTYEANSNSRTITDIPKPYVTYNTTLDVNVYAINNRGKESAVKTLKISCYAYNPPGLYKLNVIRASNTTGTADLMGSYIYGTALISFTNLILDNVEKNPASIINITVENRPSAMTITNNSTSTELKFNCSNASPESEYTIKITVTDKVTSNTITTKIPSSNFIFHVAKGGKSLGLGSAAGDEGTIKLGWKLLVNNGIEFIDTGASAKPMPISLGGTGSTSADGARQQLGLDTTYLKLSGGTLTGSLTTNQSLYAKNSLTVDGDVTFSNPNSSIKINGSSFTYNSKNIITLDDLNNELYYKTNTTITLTSGVFFGYVTSSTTEIRIVIPLKKRLDNITNVNFSNFKCVIRNIDGYAIQTNWSNEADYDYKDYITDKNINIENQSIVVQLKRDSAWKLRNNGTLSATASNIIFTLT